jgi:hypothetical protein
MSSLHESDIKLELADSTGEDFSNDNSDHEDKSSHDDDDDDDDDQVLDTNANEENDAGDENGDDASSSSVTSMTTEEADAILLDAFLKFVKYIVKDRDLPMLVNLAWSVILRCAPSDVEGHIDIKKTSFKKVSTFLRYAESQKLVNVSDENGTLSITRVNRGSQQYRQTKVADAEQFRIEVTNNYTNGSGGGKELINLQSQKQANLSNHIVTLDLYKAPKNFLNSIFSGLNGQYGNHLQMFEVKHAVQEFVQSGSLEWSTNRACVELQPGNPLFTIAKNEPNKNVPGTALSNAGNKSSKHKEEPSKQELSATANLQPVGTLFGEASEVLPDEFETSTATAAYSTGKISSQKDDLVSNEMADEFANIDFDAIRTYSDDEDDMDAGLSASAGVGMGGSVVAGVWVPSASYQQDMNADLSAKAKSQKSKIKGGSSVGGWGVDAGTKWKPVYLPSSSDYPSLGSSGAGKGKKEGNSSSGGSYAKAAGGSTGGQKGGQKGAATNSTASAQASHAGGKKKDKGKKGSETADSEPVIIHKDSLVKAICKQLVPYHAIVSKEGMSYTGVYYLVILPMKHLCIYGRIVYRILTYPYARFHASVSVLFSLHMFISLIYISCVLLQAR